MNTRPDALCGSESIIGGTDKKEYRRFCLFVVAITHDKAVRKTLTKMS